MIIRHWYFSVWAVSYEYGVSLALYQTKYGFLLLHATNAAAQGIPEQQQQGGCLSGYPSS